MAKKTAPLRETTPLTKIGLVTSVSVEKYTQRGWSEWIRILEAKNARSWTHGEIAAFLKTKYRLTPWWQHGVAQGFEIYIGRKGVNRNAKGEWSLIATKSLHIGAANVWKFLLSEKGQALWLKPLAPIVIRPKSFFETADGYFGEIRTMKTARSLRLTWRDPEWTKPSYVTVHLVPRPGAKSLVAFGHAKIPEAATQVRLRERWKLVLEQITSSLTPARASVRAAPRPRRSSSR